MGIEVGICVGIEIQKGVGLGLFVLCGKLCDVFFF